MVCKYLYDVYVCMYRMINGRFKVRILFGDNVVPIFKNQNRPHIVVQGWAGIILIDGPSIGPNVYQWCTKLDRPLADGQFAPGHRLIFLVGDLQMKIKRKNNSDNICCYMGT